MKLKYKFPCGFEFEVETGLSDMFTMGHIGFDDKDGCPIHGKQCPPKRKR